MTVAPRPPAKKLKKAKPVLEEVPDNGHPGNSKFARALGSVDFQTREKGLHALKSFLVRKNDLKEADMMKIWKGLFYCFWHSDKAPVQAELAERLAAMLTQLSEESAFLYFKCFMATMRREWFGIDRLRLDKFLMLVRKFINKMLACLKAAKWRSDLVQHYMDHIQQHVIMPGDTLPAAGLAYHCGDVMLDELRAVADGRPVPGEAVAAVLAPFAAALQGGEQVVLHRIGEGLFDTLLSELGSPSDDSPYLQQLDTAALATRLFDLGAAPSTRARNRQVLYDLSGALERMQRKRQRIETGGQAGPSSAGDAPTKGKKVAKKAAAEVAVAAAAAAPQAQTNGVAGLDGGAAAPRPTKRKAVAAGEAADEPPAVENGALEAGEQLQRQKLKGLKKKKKGQEQLQQQEEGQQEEQEQAPREEAGPSALTPQPAKAAPPSAAKRAALSNGTGHKEPTSGQKAALRAAIAKAAQPEEGAKPVKAAAVAETVATVLPPPQTPADAGGKKAAKAAAKAAKQAGETPQATPANGHAAEATTPAAAKPSALGKRSAPGTGAKAAAKSPAESGGVDEAQANGVPVGKTPVQAPARKQAVTTAKKGRVVINLKKNLYFEHGGPVPDPDVRTPPPARAKGGILKTSAKTCPPKMAVSHTPAGAAAKQQQQQAPGSQQRVLPKKAKRASAALFF